MSALPVGSVRARDVVSLAWPVLVSMVSMTLMNLADTVFAGWMGTSELAAVGLASTLGFFLLTPARGLLRGVKILTSHAAGARDTQRVGGLLVQGAWLAAACGAALLLGAPFAGAAVTTLGASPEVGSLAADYVQIMLATGPLYAMVWIVEGWFQGRGDTRTPMRAALVGNFTNVLLDPWFMFGGFGVPALGVGGAALATSAAVAVQLAVLLVQLVGAPVAAARPDGGTMRDIARFGAPLAVQWTLDSAGFMVLIGLLARAGDAELAAHVLVFRLVMMSILPGFAVADAGGVLVGQALGAGRPDAAAQAWSLAIRMAAGLMGVFGILFLLFPAVFLAPFQPDPEVAAVAVGLLGLAALWQLADGVLMCNLQALMAAGDTRFTLFATVGASWLIQVPISSVLVIGLGWGAFGGWVGITAELIALAAVSLWRVRAMAGFTAAPVALAAAR